MRGTITRVEPPRIGKDGQHYVTVHIELEGGMQAVTYLCPDNENYSHWLHMLRPGAILVNLAMKGKLIDADCRPSIVFLPPQQQDLL